MNLASVFPERPRCISGRRAGLRGRYMPPFDSSQGRPRRSESTGQEARTAASGRSFISSTLPERPRCISGRRAGLRDRYMPPFDSSNAAHVDEYSFGIDQGRPENPSSLRLSLSGPDVYRDEGFCAAPMHIGAKGGWIFRDTAHTFEPGLSNCSLSHLVLTCPLKSI